MANKLENSTVTVARAIKRAGTAYRLAQVLGITPGAVYHWRRDGRSPRRWVPKQYEPQLRAAFPDLFT